MKIHNNFIGGNIQVLQITDSVIDLDNELRDTSRDWFYWAFCVEDAAGQTLTFRFNRDLLGYFGPAVSTDLKSWKWLDSVNEDNSFTYHFGEDENRVYFAHNMLYHPERFMKFAETHGLQVDTLCMSRKGNPVPVVRLGNGSRTVFLCARHHACESPGSYVLEGVLERLLEQPLEDVQVICVPFVDLDGVLAGDQGKARAPHDHNRDYPEEGPSIYPETGEIRRLQKELGFFLSFDFHAPYHKRGMADTIYIVRNSKTVIPKYERFGKCLEECITENAIDYKHTNDLEPSEEWDTTNVPACCHYMRRRGVPLALSLETTYFGKPDNRFTQERGVELGRCFTEAIRKYISE